MITRTYLGDGVYFVEGPTMVALVTSDGIRDINTIYLEDEVLVALHLKIVQVLQMPKQA